jgi:sugar lactone lactonase YvrE
VGTPELERGDADGVAITSTGQLFLAPRLRRVNADSTAGFAHVWAEATDTAGNLYLGTGPDGAILKITSTGKQSTFFTVDEPMVTALAILPDGDLLAGTAPEGKVYRIRPDGKGKVWSKTGERYVWSLLVTKEGSVFAGTGEQGLVMRIGANGDAQEFFDSDETHIVTLRALPGGWILAGGGGRGLIYRIDDEGHALVVHDDELSEVKGLAVEPDGSIVAAILASPEPERRPPAVRIQVTGRPGAEGSTAEIQDRAGVAMEGVIEGLPAYAESGSRGLRGHVVRLSPDGTATELWRSSSEAPLCLALDPDGRPLFGAGEPARLYRVERDGAVSLLATLREAQVTGLSASGKDVAVATSNPAAAYVLGTDASDAGTFVSRPIDAGGPARWGSIAWRATGAPGRVEIYTRTGNSEDPDGTWSAWSPALTSSEGSAVVNPDGRYLQWRARLLGGGPVPAVFGTTVTYLSRNRPPEIRELRLDTPSSSVSSKAPFRWTASDPDGDPVAVEIQYRAAGTGEWKSAVRSEATTTPETDRDPGTWKEGKATWDTSGIEEGRYEIRAQAGDDGSNYPGDGRRDTIDLVDLVEVDRTAPKIEVRGKGAEIAVTDALSPVIRLEVLESGKAAFAIKPKDGVCDSRRETFALSPDDIGAPGERLLRATDAAGNTAEIPIPSS